jgi:hypothetical protein
MELWSEVRRRVLTGEISMRQARSEYDLDFRTIRKPEEMYHPKARPIGRLKDIFSAPSCDRVNGLP